MTEFLACHVAQNRTAAETTRILHREVLPYWGSWTVGEVRKRDIIALLDRVRERGSLIMANRVLAAVRKFFNWCIGRGILEASPCAGISAPAREQARHRTLSDDELSNVLAAARTMGFPFGSIVEILAHTGQRRDEAGRMTWANVDVEGALWVIPGEHAKNGKPHAVHLSGAVLAILSRAPRHQKLILSTDGKRKFQGYSKAKARLDQFVGRQRLDTA
ncbi:tyrosine-type recombinase/integrase [Microvirga brassicacearum]|uniref:Tyr recombinase domain-containing protein n=1 Tax=Microvirga brassicacearum TaxID=2580413 RepID=A0A5N3P5M4_9HYPH|nr:tyrosine-type recombinase/integrase [Microvirga brassicacearum]KAB0265030.1 hypothetical protein FEZ63_20465 [Microvirga brassicacearum]